MASTAILARLNDTRKIASNGLHLSIERACTMYAHAVLLATRSHGEPPDLESIFGSVCAENGADLVEVQQFEGQIHLLIQYPPTIAISDLLMLLKDSVPAVDWRQNVFVGSCHCPDLTQQMRRFVSQAVV